MLWALSRDFYPLSPDTVLTSKLPVQKITALPKPAQVGSDPGKPGCCGPPHAGGIL